jgi:excisionase family DNA binding protein
METLLKIEDLAATLRVHLMTAYSMVRRGDIPAIRVGRHLRVRKSDLEAWLAKQERK